MFDAGGTYISAGGGKFKLFIIQSGAVVFDIEFGDNEVNARLFEFAVREAVSAEKLSSAHFKPDGVNRVVDDAGLVGLTISWDDGYCKAVNCRFFGKIHIFSPAGGNISKKCGFCNS